jgi:hypothetical protein
MKTVKIILAGLVISAFSLMSVQAGEMTVTGSMKLASTKQGNKETGNPLGMDKELAITGSTDVNAGIFESASYKLTVGENVAFNDSEIMFTTSLGTLGMSSTGGTIEDIDNIVPTAFEEAEALIGFTATTGYVDIGNTDGTYGIVYKNAVPGGMNLTAYYTPRHGSGDSNNDDGVSGSTSAGAGAGYSVVLRGNPLNLIDGVDFAIGYENLEDTRAKATATDANSYTAALNYAYGPVKVGYQTSWYHTGNEGATTVEGYRAKNFGVAYAVNDNLSVSYQNTKSKRYSHTGDNIETDIDGYSVAYTMGGMTIAYVDNKASNANYTRNTTLTGSQVAIALAF